MINDTDVRQEFIHEILLGHCRCGMPSHSEQSMRYIQKLLNLLNDSGAESLDRFFHYDEGLKHTIYYMLDKYGLTEHGDFIERNLTEDGHDLLNKLNKLYAH